MVETKFQSQRVTEAEIRFKVDRPGNVAMENRFAYRALFSETNAKAILTLDIADPEREKVVIRAVTEGLFSIDGVETDTDRKVVNTKCFRELFPHAKANIRALAEMAGIPDVPVPEPEFGFDDIQVQPVDLRDQK